MRLFRSTILLGTAFLVGSAGVVAPVSASAASLGFCYNPGWYEDTPTSGHLIGEPTNIRSGPYLGCAINKVGHRGAAATYMCWREGENWNNTNRWTFVYSSSSRGWVNNSLLENNGSPYQCWP